jgi:hypothetical protein
MNINLRNLPEDVRESAIHMANAECEELVGWRGITEPDPEDPTRRYVIVRYMIITNKGYYESTPDGVFVRSAVLHSF